MPGKVIGENLCYGFVGTPSRMSDCVIAPYVYDADEQNNVVFGAPLALANDGHVTIATADAAPIGIAIRHLGQPHSDDANGWYYKPGDTIDVLTRGSIIVNIDGTVTPGAAVYYKASNGKYTATSSGNIAVTGAVFTGRKDSNGVGEITLTQRNI